ncbi:MAG: hypothetical protein H6757_01915 [Candidatus Omnitrophica bacterium]|nr:hypothetical protein [Candidatus Omnitrophota bacterium]
MFYPIVNILKKNRLAILAFVVLIEAMRFAFIGHADTWKYYYENVQAPDYVDWRQKHILALNQTYLPLSKIKTDRPEYLALGSSQVDVIFNYSGFFKKHGGDTLWLPLGGPLMFMMTYPYIEKRKPKNIILYLSEFDLLSDKNLSSMPLFPLSVFQMAEIFQCLQPYRQKVPDLNRGIARTFLSNLVKEQKYGFVFKALFLQWTAYRNFVPQILPPGAFPHLRIEFYGGYYKNADENMDFHLALLEKFLSKFENFPEKPRIFLVESQYDPRAYSAGNMRINSMVKAKFREFSERYTYVTYIPREAQYQIKAYEYRDSIHIRHGLSDKIVADLFRLFESAAIPVKSQ